MLGKEVPSCSCHRLVTPNGLPLLEYLRQFNKLEEFPLESGYPRGHVRGQTSCLDSGSCEPAGDRYSWHASRMRGSLRPQLCWAPLLWTPASAQSLTGRTCRFGGLAGYCRSGSRLVILEWTPSASSKRVVTFQQAMLHVRALGLPAHRKAHILNLSHERCAHQCAQCAG
eukprot:3266455-Amphidinium_carterae.3